MIAENLSTSVVQELSTLVKQLKDDRRKVMYYFVLILILGFRSASGLIKTQQLCEVKSRKTTLSW